MIAIVLALLLAPVLYLCLKPVNVGGLSASAHPAQSYAEGLERVRALDAPEAGKLAPWGGTLLLTHGRKTDRVVVLLHGYTKAPREFEPLGKLLFAKGFNVLIPRLPHHGLADRMTTDQALLTAEEMAAFGDAAVDAAHGLGEHITVAGLSAGGLTTAWLAQHRSDIDRAVVMSPAFGYKAIPTPLTRPVMNAYLTLPNSFKPWDVHPNDPPPPPIYYPRWSSHALAQLLRLSFATQYRAAEQSPAARSILVITNANDASVNNEMTARVVASWRAHPDARVAAFEFPASQGLDHDFIDPDMPHQQLQTVYPQLVEMITTDRR